MSEVASTTPLERVWNVQRPDGPTPDVPATSSSTGRRFLIAANWKCNGTVQETLDRIQFLNDSGPLPPHTDVVICAPFVHLPLLLTRLRRDMAVGAQTCNVFPDPGAYTGEVSAAMLVDLACPWTIVGHSERRAGVAHADLALPPAHCARQAKTAIDAGLLVMFCVGEMQMDRENGTTMVVIEQQLKPLAEILEEKDWAQVAIAYEPVWAIGTGLTATPAMAQDTHLAIRTWIQEHVSASVAESIRIQYGGSMKGANAAELLAQPDIDGGLVGGASLTPDFINIIQATSAPSN